MRWLGGYSLRPWGSVGGWIEVRETEERLAEGKAARLHC